MTADYQPVVEIFQVIASIATAIALFFTITTFLRLRRTEQIGLGDRFFFELSRLRKEMDELGPQETRKKKGLDWRIFNTIEWSAFLVNKKEITDQRLICFFKDVFLDFYDELLTDDYKKDPNSYPEWKKLRENIRLGVYD